MGCLSSERSAAFVYAYRLRVGTVAEEDGDTVYGGRVRMPWKVATHLLQDKVVLAQIVRRIFDTWSGERPSSFELIGFRLVEK